MKTSLLDLNSYLFEQLDRLSNEDLSGEALEHEIERSRATTDVAKAIVMNASLALKAKKYLDESGQGDNIPLNLLGGE